MLAGNEGRDFADPVGAAGGPGFAFPHRRIARPVAKGSGSKTNFGPGQKIRHAVFGLGSVIRLDGRKIHIDFDHFGRKILHLDHAKLTGVD